jgi:hypothetical protein
MEILMKKLICFVLTVALGFALVGPASAATRKARDSAPRPGQARYKRQPGGQNYRSGNNYRGRARPDPVVNGARLVSQGTLARLGDGPYVFRGDGTSGAKLTAQIRGQKVADILATDRWGHRLPVRKFARSDGRVWYSYRDPLRGQTYLFFPSSVVLDGSQVTSPTGLDGTVIQPDGAANQPPTADPIPTNEGGKDDSSPPPPDDGTPGG